MATKKTTRTKKATGNRSKNSSAKNRKSPTKAANPLTREITFLIIIVFGILSMMSVFHVCGVFGEYLGTLLFGLFGAMAYLFPVYLVVATGFFISNPNNKTVRRKVLFSIGVFWCVCGLFQWVVNDPVTSVFDTYQVGMESQGGGGFVGGILSYTLSSILGRGGALIVLLALFIAFLMLITGKLFFASLYQLYKDHEDTGEYVEYEYEDEDEEIGEEPIVTRKMNSYTFEKNTSKKNTSKEKAAEDKAAKAKTSKAKENTLKEKAAKKKEKIIDEAAEQQDEPQSLQDIHIIGGEEEKAAEEMPIYKEELEQKFGVKEKVEKVKITKEDEKEMAKVQSELDKASVTEIPYDFPPLDLLTKPSSGKKGMNHDQLRATALKLQDTLESFGVRVKLGDISLGPSVTRYELIPEQGVKVSKITSLADDIKLSLAASDIRIEAPIPGKAAVGIEVPNPNRATVTLRELLESSEFIKAKSKVTFAVGKDISGKTIVTDIAKMPHLLIAGATGSGKSVLINTLIMSIIYKANPNEVKLIMVDPKMVELTAYEEIPHLMIPVVKDPKKASAALGWAVAEMTGRYQKFAEAGVRDINSYNARISKITNKDDPEYQKMPQIVIIVDEFADLMMVAPGEVEDAVCRLAQLARAAGIHLVLATQRPSVNVITGLIKANIPSRIALSVSSQVDSRTVIDSAGAEKLLGNGDMLFAPQNLPKPIRVQGAFVSDEERDGVVNFLKNSSGGPSYDDDITKQIDTIPIGGGKNGNGAAVSNAPEQDELFAEAGMFIIEKDKASIGLLQRMFRIGFNRAARIMDQLADAGVVGPEEGTKARQIMMSKEQFENYLEENG